MQRNTKQRTAILKALQQHDQPLSVAELLEFASRDIPRLGIATVYRTLKSLQEDGSITQVSIHGNAPYYELSGKHHHHHFQCEVCHSVKDIDACLIDEKKFTSLLKKSGLKVNHHEITLFGSCEHCR